MSLAIHLYVRPQEWGRHIHDLARVAPLVAAVIAPLSVLFDIPALTETWYLKDGQKQTDPYASLILSGFGLAFSVLANALLLIRFSLTGQRWRVATWVSVACWFLKVICSTVNLIVFGALTRNQGSFQYDEGFWCAVVSDITSGIILLLLLLHFFGEFRARKHDTTLTQNVRVTGRHFMLQNTLFVGVIAISALIFSRIEQWSYLQGIYFTVVSFLTVGFGDFEPTKTASRIILFPMCLVGIAMLGSLLQMIVTFFSERSADRKAQSRAEFERERQQSENKSQNPADLAREIEFLQTLNSNQDMWDQLTEFIFSCLGFFIFWVVGAAIFSALEGWPYATGLYFCYVFFLSIGYGDFSPQSPAGRVVFIVYSLLAVPIMASFAIQAVTQIMTRVSIYRLEERKAEEGVDETTAKDHEAPVAHAEYVERFARRWESREKGNTSNPDVSGKEGESEMDALTHELIKQAMEMESHARRLLVDHLPNGSKGQVIMKADRNVQLRDVRRMRNETSQDEDDTEGRRLQKGHDVVGDADQVSMPLTDEQTLDEVNRYRESFAAMLAAASRMRGLEGDERYLLERRLARPEGEGREKGRDEQKTKEEQEDTL